MYVVRSWLNSPICSMYHQGETYHRWGKTFHTLNSRKPWQTFRAPDTCFNPAIYSLFQVENFTTMKSQSKTDTEAASFLDFLAAIDDLQAPRVIMSSGFPLHNQSRLANRPTCFRLFAARHVWTLYRPRSKISVGIYFEYFTNGRVHFSLAVIIESR